MADKHLKDVASAVVDDVINGVQTELNKVTENVCTRKSSSSKDRSLLCVLFDPCKYLKFLEVHISHHIFLIGTNKTINFPIISFECLCACSEAASDDNT